MNRWHRLHVDAERLFQLRACSFSHNGSSAALLLEFRLSLAHLLNIVFPPLTDPLSQETIAQQLAMQMLVGLIYPRVAAVQGAVWAFGRILYTLGEDGLPACLPH